MIFGKKKEKKEKYYFDYASATPVSDEVLSVLFATFGENFANSGALHSDGLKAKKIIEESRSIISENISAHSDEIVFTSGGTESDVLALKGVAQAFDIKGKPHFVISGIEHSAIFDTASQMKERDEIDLSILSVDENGLVNISELKNLIKKNTVLVSVMYVNNEIGIVQDITAISKEVRRLKKKIHGDRYFGYPLVHTDASQAMGLYPTGVLSLGIDMMSFNSGKIYGPKGVGALFVKRGSPIESIFYSGGQEGGLRPGTEATPLIAGFSKALEQAVLNKEKEIKRLTELRQYFIDELGKMNQLKDFTGLDLDFKINGLPEYTSPHILHISFKGLESDQLVIELDARGVMVSAKSACKTLDPQVSHVLSSIGYKDNSWGSIRFSFGLSTDKDAIDFAINSLRETLVKLLHTKKTFDL